MRLPSWLGMMNCVISRLLLAQRFVKLVAERICNYASVVGRDNVIAGTDCGFGTSRLHPTIANMKLQALVEGARLASQKLWHR